MKRPFVVTTGLPTGERWAGPIIGELSNYKQLVRQKSGKKWLIVGRCGPLGDYVLSLPALLDLQAYFRDYNIHWIIPARYIELSMLAGCRGCFTDAWSLAGQRWMLDPPFAIDARVIMIHDKRARKTQALWRERGYTIDYWDSAQFNNSLTTHARDRLYDALHNVGCRIRKTIGVPVFSNLMPIFHFNPRHVVMHAGTGNAAHRVSKGLWRAICSATIATGRDVIATAGPSHSELAYTRNIFEGLPVSYTQTSLTGLAQVLRSAALYVGCDTGVTHLAVECATPTIAMWKSTPRVKWRPYFGTLIPVTDTHPTLAAETKLITRMIYGKLWPHATKV